jgi:transcriptional regulator with XRE-family HTH domain
MMTTSERPIDRGRRRARQAIRLLGTEIHGARVAAGLSLEDAGRPCGMSHTEVRRIEAGELRRLDAAKLFCLADAVGLDASLRLFPGGDAVRDAAHAALLGRLRALLHPSLRWRTEVPLPIPGDRRAWDALILGDGWSCPVEAETRLGDGQALARRVALKQRDGGADHVLIIASDTRHNRLAAGSVRAAFGPTLAGPAPAVRRALADGRPPGVSALLLV